MSKQIYNSAWHIEPSRIGDLAAGNPSGLALAVSYEKAPIIVPTIKSLQRLLPSKEMLLDALIMLPLFAALLIVMLSF